jgi:competence protein ComEC
MKKQIVLLLILALVLTGCGLPSLWESTAAPTNGQQLTVHFIDVGQADCALLELDGQYMLIDGGNVADSSLVVSYLQKLGVTQLQAVVATHAHEDHAGGLPGVLAVYETGAVYAPTRTYASDCFDDFVYYTHQQGLEITIPEPGYSFPFGSATVTVLGPVKSYAETNDTSLVLLVQFGQTRFLFTGDMETTAENDMLDYWGEDFNWRVDVLKVGHHGSETSTGYRFLREVMPKFAVISVGKDNSYGHPHELPLSRLEQAGVSLYRTDKLGTILATSDGNTVTFDRMPESPAGTVGKTLYIGNISSKKFHAQDCGSLPKEENQILLDSYEAALAAGYSPCGNCLE